MKKLALIAIISLALLVLTTGTFSQQIFFNRVIPPEGSPFLHITGILQDKSGYMWFACINSLFRYDGYEMKLIKVNPADPNSIANDAASAIAVDSPGMLLINSNITPLGYCSALINAGFIHSTTLIFSPSNKLIMKKTIYLSLMTVLVLSGCSKSTKELNNNQDEKQIAFSVNAQRRTATEFGVWDNNDGVLKTTIGAPFVWGMDRFKNEYSFHQSPLLDSYDFSPYYINGETDYNPANYDVMTHFEYNSPDVVTGAVVEFTFPHIQYFVPHIAGPKQLRTYTVKNLDNQTVITCTTNLVKGWNPMFCFMVKVDCNKGKGGLTTFWTDMQVNGVSVKGSIKNKVFACN